MIASQRGDPTRAAELHESSADHLRAFSQGFVHAEQLLLSAYSARVEGRPGDALEQYREVATIVETTKDLHDRARCRHGTGRCLEMIDPNDPEAAGHLAAAAEIFQTMGVVNPEP